MLRAGHNEKWGVARRDDEHVSCKLLGYGELDQYDSRCASCYFGHLHTWGEHDASILAKQGRLAAWEEEQRGRRRHGKG